MIKTSISPIVEKIRAAENNPDSIEFARRACMRFGAFFDLRIGNKCHKKIPYYGDIQSITNDSGTFSGHYFSVRFADLSEGMVIKGVYFDTEGVISGYHFKSGIDEVVLNAKSLKHVEGHYRDAVIKFHNGDQVQGKPVYKGLGDLGGHSAAEWGPSAR